MDIDSKNAAVSNEMAAKSSTSSAHYMGTLQPSPVEQVTSDQGVGNLAFLSDYNQHDDNGDDDVRILHASFSPREKGSAAKSSSMEKWPAAESSSMEKRPVAEREEHAASPAKGGKAGEKRKLHGDVAEQERARAKEKTADFSIKNCIALLATMGELSGEERADSYDVFEDAQNREIFMEAEPSSRLIWLRRKIREREAALDMTLKLEKQKDQILQSYNEEIRKIQQIAHMHSQKLIDDNQKLRSELESKMQELDTKSRKLEELASQSDYDRRNMEQEREKNKMKTKLLMMVTREQQKAEGKRSCSRQDS